MMFSNNAKGQTEENKKIGAEYLAKFISENGGSKTASGLGYKITTPGEGKSPTATDEVEVHYHGTFINGKVFDSSYQRNQKISFPLNGVIKGWTEGLQLIKEGGKITLVIPSDLAYGDRGIPGAIPGGSTLIFEVELFKVN